MGSLCTDPPPPSSAQFPHEKIGERAVVYGVPANAISFHLTAGSDKACRAFCYPCLYFGHVKHTVVMLHQQRELLEFLRNSRLATNTVTIKEVKERNISIGQL